MSLSVDAWRKELESCYKVEQTFELFPKELFIPDSSEVTLLKKKCADDTFVEVLAIYDGTGDASENDSDSDECEYLASSDKITDDIIKLSQVETQELQLFCDSLS